MSKLQRSPLRLFIRIKDLRDIDPRVECFRCRFRTFAYWSDEALASQLEADEQSSLAKLAAQRFKVSQGKLSDGVQALLPTLSIVNKVSVDETGAAEFMVKPKDMVGYQFCLTVQYSATLSFEFDLRNFPFDSHALPIELALKKAADIKRFHLEVSEGLSDPEESIPFTDDAAPRAWMPDGWRATARSPYELEAFDTAEWLVHAGGSTRTPWNASHANDKKPAVSFSLQITRRSKLYLRDIMLLNSCIVTTVFLSPAGKHHFNERCGQRDHTQTAAPCALAL